MAKTLVAIALPFLAVITVGTLAVIIYDAIEGFFKRR